MPTRGKPKRQFAICIQTDDPDLLTPRRIYEVLPDESAAKSQYIRVIDNEGEDYLYPASYFVFVDFPPAVEQALLQASQASEVGASNRIARKVGAIKSEGSVRRREPEGGEVGESLLRRGERGEQA